MTTSQNTKMAKSIFSAVYLAGLSHVMYLALKEAFNIRLYAIQEYGRVIHEFDPYFNYRATEYLWQHGWLKFRTWFDYMSWYPLGRPVGTTIYPGMQITSTLIKKFVLTDWSINDICCFVPAWFGVLATFATALLAYECSVGSYKTSKGKKPQQYDTILNAFPVIRHIYQVSIKPLVDLLLDLSQKYLGTSFGLRYCHNTQPSNSNFGTPALECAIFTACVMSIVPAHIMRSVGGGYDNESVAMFAMSFTFFSWCRSLRGNDEPNYAWAVVSGLAYAYMVAAWGGYVFVLNLIGVHASVLVLMGRYTTKLHRSYTLFYAIGTFLAIQVPVVGWTPLKSLEQMGPLLAFLGFQLIEFCQIQKRKQKLNTKQTWILRIKVFVAAGLLGLAVVTFLAYQGYFGPISARVRGLFVKHTKTGNPLVDSVAEHQPATDGAYAQYLGECMKLLPAGFALVSLVFFHDSSSFLVVYGVAAYFFSNRMVRLILLTAPIASVFCGITLGHLVGWGLSALLGTERPSLYALLFADDETEAKKEPVVAEAVGATNGTKKDKKKLKKGKKEEEETTPAVAVEPAVAATGENVLFRILRVGICYYIGWYMIRPKADTFFNTSHEMARALSHPTIIQKGQTHSGEHVMVDDYREAYWWLRDHTPQDARVMAWWDYGYQIAGIANRTTIADGNTWNHEHIALLGRALTSPLKDGHRIARHLADYVLIWAGGGGDDLAKSPHMRRIANSVYRFLCPGDPTCRSFGVNNYGQPTKAMKKSLLYALHSHGLQPGVEADKNRFKLSFESKHGKVRIFKVLSVSKESKAWVIDPANRECDAPGSWFCRGQYPPGLQKVLKEKKDFKQLEDFNVGGDSDSDYTKQYLENLNDPDKARQAARKAARDTQKGEPKEKKNRITKLKADEIQLMNNPEAWDDNSMTTAAWNAIHNDDIRTFRDMLVDSPEMAHVRSKDGRGPMWWAHEYGRENFKKLLKNLGVVDDLKDVNGITPLDLMK